MGQNQLFIVTAEAFFAASQEEVDATVLALKEAKLYALPYHAIDVRIAGDCVARYSPILHTHDNVKFEDYYKRGLLIEMPDGRYRSNLGDGYWIDFKNICLEHSNYEKIFVVDNSNRWLAPHESNITQSFGDEYKPVADERDAVANILMVLLATRNVVKTTKHSKLAKLGIGGKKAGSTRRYEYVTTISVPKELEADEEHTPTGIERAPHLRRGHVRRQHHGPKNVLVKTVWIAPVFVNADKTWVSQRTAYNVSL